MGTGLASISANVRKEVRTNGGREAVGVVPCADPECLSTRVGARHRIGASPIRPYDAPFVLGAARTFAPMGLAPSLSSIARCYVDPNGFLAIAAPLRG